MVDIDSANHRWLVKERHVADRPGLTTNLSTDLDEDLGANGAHVFATRDRVGKDDLRRDRQVLEKQTFEVVVEGGLAFGSWKDAYNSLHLRVEISSELFFPILEPVGPDRELTRLVHAILDLIEALLHSFEEHGGSSTILFAEKDSPSEQRGLVEHLSLDFAV